MNIFECFGNTTLCNELFGLAPCSRSLVENRCVEDNGICYINRKDPTRCLCSPCFTGDYCEKELSRNSWRAGMLYNVKDFRLISINHIVENIFCIFHLFNALLCLQTYLCRKIRQTNLGIYLIMLSIISIIINLLRLIWSSILFYIKFKGLERSISISCRTNKYVYALFPHMFNWFIAAVAIERVLVECSIKYGLYDSRRRSVIFSVIIVIVCSISTLPGVFTVRDDLSLNLQSIYCQNLTPVGYIVYEAVISIHRFAFYFVYILMNITVIIKLVRRQQRFVDNSSLSEQSILILSKHKDFFIPYLIQAICQLPLIVMDYIMTCSTANTMSMLYLFFICHALQYLPFVLMFYLYVNLSPVYLSIFWDSSLVGRFLMKIKHKLQIVYENRINHNSILLETYT